MKKTIVLFLLILPFYISIAQVIKGKVLNEIDQPIPNTTIYLDGTTIGTSSKEDGSFTLDLSFKKNAQVVFQKESYGTFITPIADIVNKTLKVVLMKTNTIEEVKIIPYTEESYKNFIKYFLDTFIGSDKENVKIKNQKTLKFSYDKKNQVLNVKAPKTLLIENKNLGYEIEYNLMGFSADFKTNMFNYIGTSFFKKTKNTDRIKLNRMNAYEGSMLHFFRCVFQNTVSKDGFIVNKVIEVPNPQYPTEDELSKLDNFREMVKNTRDIKIPGDISDIMRRKNKEKPYALAITKLKIPISDYTSRNENNVLFSFQDMLQVNYIKYFYELKNKQFVKSTIPVALSSFLRSEGETFEVSKEGNITTPNQLINEGDFSKNRIENLLPLDYQLED